MGVSTKGRRKIVVGDQRYVWYVAPDDETPYHVLNIVSDDKRLILSCPLLAGTEYIISKGRVFQTQGTNGVWNRYLLPFGVPDAVTPKFIERLIVWATQDSDTIPIDASDVPL